MIRNTLEHINGIATLPLFALVLFVLVFVGMAYWAYQLRRPYVDHMGNLPLEDDQPSMSKE
jgi:cbb3-type cytochrome oxidase subunit 3